MELGPLPNGWECKYDTNTRRNYFINYVNKTTTWDDPRVKPQANIPSSFSERPELITLQDASSLRPSPVTVRAHTAPIMGSYAIGHHINSKMQETSFNNVNSTEQSVARISAMFPTVAETHIRALLIKYHSRDAVVISALQVEKNPITTPGPFSTPPLIRHIVVPTPLPPPHYHSTPPSGLRDCSSTPPPSLYSCGIGTGTGGGTLTGSPASSSYLGSPAFRHSPRPHSSPKMKLRYMKSLFPRADETIILDTLYNVENNVQAATKQLQAMGFDKRDTPSRAGTPVSKLQEKSNKDEEVKEPKKSSFTPPARLKSVEEKQDMRDRLKKLHPDLGDHLISLALDSVDYDENKANHVLNLMLKEDNTPKSSLPNSASSSERPCSKSENTEALSLETKTTVEADVILSGDSIRPDSTETMESKPRQGLDTVVQVLMAGEELIDDKLNENSQSHSCFGRGLLIEKACGKKVKSKKNVPKVSRGTSTTEDQEYRSSLRLASVGPNLSLHFGPNDELLLEEYITWKGPVARVGHKGGCNAYGPNKALLSARVYTSKGPNKDLCKGPKPGLAKGSIYYSQLATNSAINQVDIGEYRGK